MSALSQLQLILVPGDSTFLDCKAFAVTWMDLILMLGDPNTVFNILLLAGLQEYPPLFHPNQTHYMLIPLLWPTTPNQRIPLRK